MRNCDLESYSSFCVFSVCWKKDLSYLLMVHILRMGWGRKLCHLLPICSIGKQQTHNALSIALLSLLALLDLNHIVYATRKLPLRTTFRTKSTHIQKRIQFTFLSMCIWEDFCHFSTSVQFKKFGINKQIRGGGKKKKRCIGVNSVITFTTKQSLL